MATMMEAVISRYGTSAWELLRDRSCSEHVRRNIGYQVVGGDEVIIDMPFEQLMMVMSAAKFAADDYERVTVAKMVHWIIKKSDVLPMVHCHKGFDLASRCLISIALFKKAMAWRTRFRGCPTISFYRAVGIQASEQSGFEDIASHFDSWSGFIGETLSG